MTDFIYFAKLLGVTIVVIVVLQLNVGNRSLETHAMNWLQSSSVITPLHAVAHGGGKLMHDLSERVNGVIQTNRAKKKRDVSRDSITPRFRWSQAPLPSKSGDLDDGDPD